MGVILTNCIVITVMQVLCSMPKVTVLTSLSFYFICFVTCFIVRIIWCFTFQLYKTTLLNTTAWILTQARLKLLRNDISAHGRREHFNTPLNVTVINQTQIVHIMKTRLPWIDCIATFSCRRNTWESAIVTCNNYNDIV